MHGRIFSYPIPLAFAEVEVAKRNPERRRITFRVGQANTLGSKVSCLLLDGLDRENDYSVKFPAGGLPVGHAPLVIEGEQATHRFSMFVGMLTNDMVCGVVEEFDDPS